METKRCLGCMKIKSASPVCEHCGYDESSGNASHQLIAGSVLKEQYLIGRVLGQGGFGITYLGWDLYLDIPVAIKEYYPNGMVMREATVTMNVSDTTGDDGTRFRNSRDRFLREAKMLARFSQVPEVVQVRNFFLANNTAYIVMEYVEGITLKQYVKDRGGKLSPRETFGILEPVIQTLSKVHKTGIIHRDISPDNIMMLPDGGAKVLDFGAVRDVTGASIDRELTKSTEAILKQGYAPIEQYQKKGALGPWTDVYALCATIYYCLTGQTPPDAPARMLEYEELDLAPVKDLTREQRSALIHGLEIRAERRTPSMEELYRELFLTEEKPESQAVLQPEPQPEAKDKNRPETQKMTGKDPGERNKTFFAVFFGAALIVFVALILSLGNPDWADEAGFISGFHVEKGTCGENLSWELDLDSGVMRITGTGEMDDFYLDSYNDSDREGRVPRPWEAFTDRITRVSLEGGVTKVGSAAFAHCVNLQDVELCEGIWELGMEAFRDTGITQLRLPDSLTYIGAHAFSETRLREVEISGPFVSMAHAVFNSCPELTTVTLGSGTSWCYDTWGKELMFTREGNAHQDITLRGPGGGIAEDYAAIFGYRFESTGQTEFEGQGDFSAYPGNAEGYWFFDRETHFLKIEGEMPTDMVGQWELENNEVEPQRQNIPLAPWTEYAEDIYIVSLEEGVTRICDNAFAHCWQLTDIHLPSTLQSIGFQSFLDTNLDEIVIPNSVTEISSFAFNYCRNLHIVKLSYELEVLQQSVFNVTPALDTLYAGNLTRFERGWHNGVLVTPFNSNGVNPDVDETALPEHLTICTPQQQENGSLSPAKEFAEELGFGYDSRILGYEDAQACGDTAFGVSPICWALQDGVLTLMGTGETPFFRCASQDRNAWGQHRDPGMLRPGEAPWYIYRNEIHTVVVGQGITALNRGVFCDMPNLEWLDLGSTERIYEGAIDNCGMEMLLLHDTLAWIHKGAIQDCPNLRIMEIHNGSEKIDNSAIENCYRLEELYFWSGGEALLANGSLFSGLAPENLTIYGRPGSPAEAYANRSNTPFETLE